MGLVHWPAGEGGRGGGGLGGGGLLRLIDVSLKEEDNSVVCACPIQYKYAPH